jgi:D-3-phosphoglycerate dehydrogenase
MRVIALTLSCPRNGGGTRGGAGRLDALFRRADFITLHTPLTDKTGTSSTARPSQNEGGRADRELRAGRADRRGGVAVALDSGRVAGAGVDVFAEEPATNNVLFGAPNLVCTPHLGASTNEAQENVAIQIAEQMATISPPARCVTP